MTVPRIAALATIAALFVLAASTSAAAAAPHAADAKPPAQALTLDHGKKWATDAPLRAGMGDIRAALAPKLDAIHAGELSVADYRALGELVEKRVGDIVAKCKLPPAADANLHVIVAGLVAAADAMQGKDRAVKPAMGAERAVRLVDQYGEYFDDPAFKPLAAPSIASPVARILPADR